MQADYCRDIERVHFGKAPALHTVATAYGRVAAEVWMIAHLNNLSLFAGCKGKLSAEQVDEMARIILDTYGHYKLTEFMLFFQRFKQCRYGRFYGAVDPMVIMGALAEFNAERHHAHIVHEGEERRRRAEADRRADEELRLRYAARVPGAFGPKAALSFLQYRLMGYDTMTDEALAAELDEITSGRKSIPADVAEMLNMLKQTFNT